MMREPIRVIMGVRTARTGIPGVRKIFLSSRSVYQKESKGTVLFDSKGTILIHAARRNILHLRSCSLTMISCSTADLHEAGFV